MAYFDSFQDKVFRTSDGEVHLVKDVIIAIKIPDYVMNNQDLFYNYRLEDGETPEMVSHKIYGSTMYHWIIMVINGRHDVWADFPKSDYILRKSIVNEGSDPDQIHHYENAQGKWVDYTYPLATPITQIEYAHQINEQKRFVLVLRPSYLSEFVDTYKRLIEEA